jgi:hypothetical protein
MSKHEAAMVDSRVMNWRLIKESPPPTGCAYYVAGILSMPQWTIARVDPARVDPCLNPPGWASHWAPDLLGLPYTP